MIAIAEAISDLLFVRDTVVVPGLGAFVKKPTSAKVNSMTESFAMPSADIAFDANLREDNELLVRYLSEKNEIPEDEAKKLLAMFVSDCFNTLKNKKQIVLDGIGTLSYDWADDLAFKQETGVNYNSDSFGLSDITPVLVVRSKPKEENKAEIEQPQKEKNTPVTVNEEEVHQKDKEKEQEKLKVHNGWLWVLTGVMLLVVVGYALLYFKVMDFGKEKEQPKERAPYEEKTYMVPSYSWNWEWKDLTPKANIQIVAGCYNREEDAARFANKLKDDGFTEAFYELRNDKWFVSFGRYDTEEEAMEALREIRGNTEYKAWIRK